MLKIDQLVSGYGTVQILNGANMKVDNQSIVALLGGNGTGKSTILKATSGLIRAWKGSIEFDGEQIHNLPPHEIVGRGLVQVTQGKDVFPAMSVTENLRLGGFILKTKKQLNDNLEKVFNYFPRGPSQLRDPVQLRGLNHQLGQEELKRPTWQDFLAAISPTYVCKVPHHHHRSVLLFRSVMVFTFAECLPSVYVVSAIKMIH